MSTSPRSGSRLRPAFRVVCAWCQESLPASQPSPTLTGTSHGICRPCALKHFGIRLDPIAEA